MLCAWSAHSAPTVATLSGTSQDFVNHVGLLSRGVQSEGEWEDVIPCDDFPGPRWPCQGKGMFLRC